MPAGHIMTDAYRRAAEWVRRESEAALARREGAVRWLGETRGRVAAAWLPRDYPLRSENANLWHALLTDSERAYFRSRLSRPERAWERRVTSAVNDRFALVAAGELLGTALAGPSAPELPPHALGLSHTNLGQPLARWRGGGEAWSAGTGLEERNLHVSFTHDGEAHVGVVAYARGLRGVGVDVVHLPRLAGRGVDYLRRFARHFMSEEEYAGFLAASAGEEAGALLERVAAHFSLMEAASKALGTGLKIGGGMGRPESLLKQSLNVAVLTPEVRFSLAEDAQARCKTLGAARPEGHWSSDGEYLVSLVLLWDS